MKNDDDMKKDVWLYRIIVTTLGLTVVVAVIGAITLAILTEQPTPEVLVALGSAAIGGLAGFLVPTNINR